MNKKLTEVLTKLASSKLVQKELTVSVKEQGERALQLLQASGLRSAKISEGLFVIASEVEYEYSPKVAKLEAALKERKVLERAKQIAKPVKVSEVLRFTASKEANE